MRVVNAVFTVLFLICVGLQYNDPDPIQWMAIYGAAAIVCAIEAFRPGRVHWIWPVLIAAVAFAWSMTEIGALQKIAPSDLARTMEAETPAIEESRESLGLLIVTASMALVAIASRRRRSAPASH